MLLAQAAILGLIANPACGNVSSADKVQTAQLYATVMGESGGDPLIIGVNAEPARGLAAYKVLSVTADDAAAKAEALLAQGRRIDLGLFQISNAQSQRHHLTIRMAFDACANTAAGVQHLADDYQAVLWELAHRRYNCGRSDCGEAYAARIMALAKTAPAAIPPAPAPQPPPSSCAPTWDAWALVACTSQTRIALTSKEKADETH